MPIIFITAHGDVPMTVRAMKAGAVEFLTKPFEVEVLLEAIGSAIERSRAALLREAETRALRERYASLTPREREVMGLVVAGLLNKQVGFELGISEITVKAHRGQVMRKMKADSLPDLVTMAARLGLSVCVEELTVGDLSASPRPLSAVSRAFVGDVAYVVGIEAAGSAPVTVRRRASGVDRPTDSTRRLSVAKRPLISAYGTRLASPAKLPFDLNVWAARTKPVHAARASAPPTLMRRTPSAAMSSDTQADVPNHEEIQRLRCNCLDQRLDFRGVLQARGEEHVGSRRGVGLQTSHRFAEDRDDQLGSTRRGRSAARRRRIDRSPVARRGRARPRSATRTEATPDRPWRPRSTGPQRPLRRTERRSRPRPPAPVHTRT